MDGRAFPIFSRQDQVVHCNICDVTIVCTTEEVVNHVISTSHRNRLLDTHRATAALLGRSDSFSPFIFHSI